MQLGLFMATQWPANAKLTMEMSNLCEQTRFAKSNGFSSVMVGQHFLSEPLQMIQAEPLIARLAAEGEGMTFGITVLLLAMQNPVMVAESAASLDWITDGNYVLGVGLGYRREEFEALGVEFDQRVSRFEEAIPLIRRLWTEDSVTHHGKHFTVNGLGASIKPKRGGGPPIWVGGDVVAAVKRAAKLGCPWIAPPTMTFDEITERVNAYKETQTELGIYHGGGQPIIREVAIGATKQEALEAAGPSLLAKYESYASWGQTATKEQVSLADTFDDFIKDRFIIGDEYEVADELERYQESFGEGEFLVRIQWPGFEQPEVLDTIGRLGKIISRFS
jgi:alkanesulfonate monooxygenase SsuD/methylene tetrahydromethanopterin reductase-like flavin-dependent oxidoreductase (luciferase family)